MRIHYSAGFISYLSLIPLIFLSQLKETYMLLMEYPYIICEYFTDYAKKVTWNLLHAYIYAHSQKLIDEYLEYGVQKISRLQS